MDATLVSSLLHVNPETVRRWVRSGELKSLRVGKAIDISESDLHDFMKDRPKYAKMLSSKETDSKNYNKITISEKDFEIIQDILCLNGRVSPMAKDEQDCYYNVLKQHYDKLSENGRKLVDNRVIVEAAECMNHIRGYKNLLSSVVAYSYDAHDMEYYANLISVKARELEILLQKIDILPSQK
jgi:excisionase family DNA binding protein